MGNALSPREIQTRIRAGESVAEVAAEAGMELDRVEAFAGPVLAEREHIASAAQGATVRRRGEAGGHRHLGELIAHRLRNRGLDADEVSWDAWRQANLKWRVVGTLSTADIDQRVAEFIYDPKGRYSIADNADARWMIGEESFGATVEDETTVDFQDEFALVRATQIKSEPGDDVPRPELMQDGNEDTSQLDRLYDMLSGISEDSVRIYTGLLAEDEESSSSMAPVHDEDGPNSDEHPASVPSPATGDDEPSPAFGAARALETTGAEETMSPVKGQDLKAQPDPAGQEALVDDEAEVKPAPKKPRKRRAAIPSWDEIMFGGPTPS